MKKVPTRVDGRFRLGDVLGSGAYAVVYHAQNFLKDDLVAINLEPIINFCSSLQHEYNILQRLAGGVGIPRTFWFGRESTYHALVLDLLGPLCNVVNLGDQLLSHLEYIHSHNFVHGDIKSQNILIGLNDLRHTAFIIDFGVTKEYCSTSTRTHVPFHQGQNLTGTPVFTSINSHLGVETGRHDDIESLIYTLIYLLRGSLPWLTDDHERLSSSAMLERKFASLLIYTCSLAFSQDPDYDYLRSLLHDLHATLPVPASYLLDFSKSYPITHAPAFPDYHRVAEAMPSSPLKATPLRKSTRV
ncbi:kinase-like domain-containing protein [Suillus placidus]|uniref:non-specific serine/threonine protein kinase n=1 Tax=Suillus placidus TaxID=48579 RepID=A0A9P7A435_9AGAM|nr:kinase-like domain-containing protein [Suillus placidus]